MVNKENIQKWVAALRSGEYRQEKNFLAVVHDDGTTGYCCLGVACEVARANGLDLSRQERSDERYDIASRSLVPAKVIVYGDSHKILPPSVAEWLGLTETEPRLDHSDDMHSESAAEINDSGDFNFGDIATMIERTYL